MSYEIKCRDLVAASPAKVEQLKTRMQEKTLVMQDSLFRDVLEQFLERGYLTDLPESKFLAEPMRHSDITWLQITRVPIHPDQMESYDLLTRWQGVLSTLHMWGLRTYFLLLRRSGETRLFLGTASFSQKASAQELIGLVREAAFGSMPGMELKFLDEKEAFGHISRPFLEMNAIGAITGLPSLKKEGGAAEMMQTLDQLAFGLRDQNDQEKDFALLTIADPICDSEITDIIASYRSLGSRIHTYVNQSISKSHSDGTNKNGPGNPYIGMTAGGLTGEVLAKLCGAILPSMLGGAGGLILGLLPDLGRIAGSAVSTGDRESTNTSDSFSRTEQNLDKFAQYAEQCIDMHIDRFKQGRNLGMWNVGVYVLAKMPMDVQCVTGMLRSIYSGSQSYLEPIRAHILKPGCGALEIVRDKMDLIPLRRAAPEAGKDAWHILGRHFQYASTPMNTMEFSLATSLPRRDVPGIRFVKTAVRFANNATPLPGDQIRLGRIMDYGVEQNNEYSIRPDILVRHALVAGSTGSGKSTTCKRIVDEVRRRHIPVLIIEPAKDDYVRWAMKQNETLPPEERWRIYMPGLRVFDGQMLEQLALNPFEPAAIPGAPVDMQARCENIIALLNAALPNSDVLPTIIDETVYHYLEKTMGKHYGDALIPQQPDYPMLEGLLPAGLEVLKNRQYAPEVRSNLQGCLETRLSYLTRGTRGRLMNVPKSTSYHELFSKPSIINLSRVSASKDKALIMSILALSIQEYRQSAYMFDDAYRARAQKDELMHLSLLEEAHHLLLRPSQDFQGVGNPQQIVADLFGNMLSEARSTGEGMVIVDQAPTRLIPDVVKNTNLKITHRLIAPDDCEVMAAGMALRKEQQALIPAMACGQAILFSDEDDGAAWVKMYKE